MGTELSQSEDRRRQHVARWMRPYPSLRISSKDSRRDLRQGPEWQGRDRRRRDGDPARYQDPPGPSCPYRRLAASRGVHVDRQADVRERCLLVVGGHPRLDDRQPAADRYRAAIPRVREVLQGHRRLPELRRGARATLVYREVPAHEELVGRTERLPDGRDRACPRREVAQAVTPS